MNTGQIVAEDLADFVKRVRFDKGFSQRDVETKARARGFKISKGYIGQIENREVLGQSVTPRKLTALAIGLEEHPDVVVAIARGKPITYEDPLDLMGLFDGWDEATDEERAAALDDLRMIAERFQRRRKSRQPVNGTGKVKGKK